MKLDLIALCDAAVEVNGRFNLLGTIDYFWAASLPYVHPKCALALRLRFHPSEQGTFPIRILVVDPDGRPILSKADLKIQVDPPEDDIPSVRHAILEMHSLRFERYGPYAVHVEVKRGYVATLPFAVVPPHVNNRTHPRFAL